MGMGFRSVGDLVPGTMAELGAQDIRVCMSDRATPTLSLRLRPQRKVLLAYCHLDCWAVHRRLARSTLDQRLLLFSPR